MTLAVHLADAGYGWVYVVVGWSLTGVVLAAYFSRLVVRIRRAERTLPPEPAARGPVAVGGSTVRPHENLGER